MRTAGFFRKQPWQRAILESMALTFLFMALLNASLLETQQDNFFFAAIATIAGVYASLRASPFTGSKVKVLFYEIISAMVLWAGQMAANYLAYTFTSFFDPARLRSGISAIDFLACTYASGLYVAGHFALRLLEKWNQMRRARFVWSVMQALALIILGMILLAVIIVMILFLQADMVDLQAPGVPAQIMDQTFQLIFWLMLAIPVVIIPVLILMFPPMALVSYWMSRRLSRRLAQLQEAAHLLSQGDLSARSPLEGEDEIAHLQADFNQMADQLEKSNRALQNERSRVEGLLDAQRRLTASVSHELRTPVAIALAALENALEQGENPLPGPDQKDLETARHEVQHLEKLIDDLFMVSKAELNQMDLRMAPTDLRPVIQNVVNTMQSLAWKSRKVRVSAELPPTLPLVNTEARRIEQILINLINNGVRHTPPGGFVMVTAEAAAEKINVSVIDSGEGVAQEDLPHIWEPFYSGDRNADGERSGLGLVIVKELVNSMGGEVAVESEPGQGCVFTFSLKPSRHDSSAGG